MRLAKTTRLQNGSGMSLLRSVLRHLRHSPSIPSKAGIVGLAVVLMPAVCVLAQDGGKTVIENETLRVTWDANQNSFAVLAKASGKTFLANGRFSGTGGRASVVQEQGRFGRCEVIGLTYPDGHRDSIRLVPSLPFVLFDSTLHNDGSEALVTNHVHLVTSTLNLGKAATDLRAFGTGGLQTLEKNTGSYAYLAVVDPETRAGVVGGWLTHHRGSGVVF